MGYIKKTSTLLLLFLLLVSLLSFGGSTIIYHRAMERLTFDIQAKDAEARLLKDTLSSLRTNHTDLIEKFTKKEQDEKELSEQYVGVKEEKDTLTEEKLSLEEQLDDTKRDLRAAFLNITYLEDEIENRDYQIEVLEIKVDNMTDELDDILDDVQDICDDASSLNLTRCDDYT